MAVVVATLPLSQSDEQMSSVESPAEARKRRREILTSQRGALAESPADAVESGASCKKRKVVTADVPASSPISAAKVSVIPSKTGKAKKPQMKYDPEVPMSKDQVANWRRDQRRKRNRESAAASRQRQRDRIAELEVEVDGWKFKFEQVMKKIQQLEEAAAKPVEGDETPAHCGGAGASIQSRDPSTSSEASSSESSLEHGPTRKLRIQVPTGTVQETTKDAAMISPPSSPSHSTNSTPPGSPADYPQDHNIEAHKAASSEASQVSDEEVEELQPFKMISRPAVKITGSTSLPLLPDGSTLLSPDPCTSLTAAATITLEPIDSNLFPNPTVKDEATPTLLTDDRGNEEEFGEFLLDAVDWL